MLFSVISPDTAIVMCSDYRPNKASWPRCVNAIVFPSSNPDPANGPTMPGGQDGAGAEKWGMRPEPGMPSVLGSAQIT